LKTERRGPWTVDRGPRQTTSKETAARSAITSVWHHRETCRGAHGSAHGPRPTAHVVNLFAIVLAAALGFAAGCASGRRAGTAPTTGGSGYAEEGLASWYGEPYHGRPTASGPRYDMNEMTAAHRTLPFGTLVRVTNLENGRHATVLINDRGPFVAGRIIDLSRAAAEAIESIGPGVVRVRLEVVREGDGMVSDPCWEVQVGAFAQETNASRARANLESKGYSVRLAPAGGGLTRVRATAVGNRDKALATARRLSGEYPGAVAVPCGGWS
jgi:rare lipoprotein A